MCFASAEMFRSERGGTSLCSDKIFCYTKRGRCGIIYTKMIFYGNTARLISCDYQNSP